VTGADILALDVGTSGLKAGVYGPDLAKRASAGRDYDINLYDRGKADIWPETWWSAIRDACAELRAHLHDVAVVSLSVTTPGLTPMAADGSALGPAILFLDGRSHEQAAAIRKAVGEDRFLIQACNLPVSGGSSLPIAFTMGTRFDRSWENTRSTSAVFISGSNSSRSASYGSSSYPTASAFSIQSPTTFSKWGAKAAKSFRLRASAHAGIALAVVSANSATRREGIFVARSKSLRATFTSLASVESGSREATSSEAVAIRSPTSPAVARSWMSLSSVAD